MKWTDIQRIAEELYDTHGDSINPATVRFTQLRDLILALPDFDATPTVAAKKILEAVHRLGLTKRSRAGAYGKPCGIAIAQSPCGLPRCFQLPIKV